MATNAYMSNLKMELVDTTVSPNTYEEIEEITGGVTVGESTPLVDVSHFQSEAREFIGGLPEGDEFSAECNDVIASPSVQQKIKALKGQTRRFRITLTNTRVSPNTTRVYLQDLVILGWQQSPSVGEANKFTLNFKISGGVS
ncbi:MAG: hypothetical protein ACN2B6_00610 [Rickettsiales bacterium]